MSENQIIETQKNQMEQQKKPANVVVQVKNILAEESVKNRFQEVLGKKAPQFMASIVNVVSASPQLRQCQPNSIMSAAFIAATYDLPIDSNLGFSAIVPYNNNKYNPQTRQWEKQMEAQFQMMYKGFIQLAIRSGYYERMNCSAVYEDEFVSYNPITGELRVVADFSHCTQRMNGEDDKIVGYHAGFKLITGFSKELYMSKAEVEHHARTYSSSYRYDIEKGKKSSNWTTNFKSMALKTVIKLLLSKWGIMSVDMQRAIQDDQKTFDENGEDNYGDNQPDIVQAEDPFESVSEDVEVEELDITQ